MSSPSSSADSSPGLRVTIAAAAAGFLTFLNMWCTQAILPVLIATFHATPAQVSLTVTAPLLGTASMAPLAGMISDRFGRKRLIVGAAFLLAIPTTLAAAAPNLDVLTLCRLAQGMTLPFIFTVTIAYIGDELSGAAATKLAGIYTSGTILGGFSGRLISGGITQLLDWRLALCSIALLTLALAVFVLVLLPREQRFRPVYGLRSALHAFPLHLSNLRLLGAYAVGFSMLFSLVAVFTFINFRLAAAPYALGPAALGGIFVVYLGGVAISPVAARFAVAYGRRIVMACAVGAIWTGLLLTLAPQFWIIMLGLLVACLGIFSEQTLAVSFVPQVARGAKSTAVGLYVTTYYIGGSCGGTLPAGAYHNFGWAGCAAVVAVVQVGALVAGMLTWRQTKPANA